MKDAAFQREQMEGRYLPHVEPINRMVDELRTDTDWLPYVAPTYGGVHARVLAILRDPGPKTLDVAGSGMLCVENDDPTAERYHDLLTGAGIACDDVIAWNAYPWYINSKPDTAQLERALPVLNRLIGMCSRLEVVMVHGGDAHRAWRMYRERYPASAPGLRVVETYHTSRGALRHEDPDVRQAREDKLRADFAEVAAILRPNRAPHQNEPSDVPAPPAGRIRSA